CVPDAGRRPWVAWCAGEVSADLGARRDGAARHPRPRLCLSQENEMKNFLLLAFLLVASPAVAQVGKSLGVVDANTASEQVLAAAPNMTAPIVKALIAAR